MNSLYDEVGNSEKSDGNENISCARSAHNFTYTCTSNHAPEINLQETNNTYGLMIPDSTGSVTNKGNVQENV